MEDVKVHASQSKGLDDNLQETQSSSADLVAWVVHHCLPVDKTNLPKAQLLYYG